MPGVASAAMLQTAKDVLAISQQLVPVDTTSLKKSGGVEVIDSSTVVVGYGGPGVYYSNREPEKYALHVEYGTALSPAQPYLRPAMMQAEPIFRVRFAEEASKAV
jgi:hypothetical protein